MDWFEKLFELEVPDELTRGQLKYRCQAAHAAFSQMDSSEAKKFLSFCIVDNVDECLRRLGLTKSILLCSKPEGYVRVHNCKLTNEVVSALNAFAKTERLPTTFVNRWLCALTDIDISESQMRHLSGQILKKVSVLRKGKDRNLLNSFLKDDVQFIRKEQNKEAAEVSKLNKTIDKYQSKCKEVQKEVEELHGIKNVLIEEKREMLLNQSIEVENLKHRLCPTPAEKKSRGIQVSDNLEKKFVTMEQNMKGMESEKENLEKENEKLQNKVEKLENQICALKKQIKLEQTMKSEYKKKFEDLKMTSEVLLETEFDNQCDTTTVELKGSSNNVFSDAVRLTYMSLQGEANVSASNCSKVVNIISKYLYKKEIPLESLPSTQTALNMATEGQYLSKQHAVETILQCPHFMLGTDGTSRDKRQYIERHIQLSDGNVMSLGFTEVSSDNAQNLLEKTVELLQELTTIYYEKEEAAERDAIFKEILSKMKCLMSDRAAVMKLFNKKISELKMDTIGEDADTNFLYCNAHFLLGIASIVEPTIKEMEEKCTENGERLGRDEEQGAFARFAFSSESSVMRLVRAASECFGPRGDDKSGCRSQWLSFLEGLAGNVKSRFSSFRSNRFNNTFDNASAIIFHRDHIIRFLENYCTHSNLKLKSILLDILDERVINMVSALDRLNYLFTSPYWRLMNSHITYDQFSAIVQKLQAFLKSADPVSSVALPEFADPLLQPCPPNESNIIFNQTFSSLCSRALAVLERQLCDFVGDGVFANSIPDDVVQVLKTCPLTNLTGERLFGDLDFDMFKRRRASLFLRSSINMWKRNKTGQWMSKKKKLEAVRLFTLARGQREESRRRSRENEREVRRQLRENMEENHRRKQEKEVIDRERHNKMKV